MEYKTKYPQVTLNYVNDIIEEQYINGSRDAFDLFIYEMDHGMFELKEEMRIIYLDNSGKVVCVYHLSTGTTTACLVDIKHILAVAILSNASAIISGHNHPSKKLKPSQADINIHSKLKKACKVHDITLHDTIIFSRNGYYSFADEGIL